MARRSAAEETLLDIPVATIVHLIAVLAVAVVFVINSGELPDDVAQFFAIVIGGNGLVAVGRGFAARKPG
jgi:hypothetical protein